jgi:hypothetical protein
VKWLLCSFLGAFAYSKSRNAPMRFIMSAWHVWNRLPLDGFPRLLILQNFMKICLENLNVFRLGQKHRALYMNNQVRFVAASDIKSSCKRSIRVMWYRIFRIAERYQHYANVQQNYVILISPVFVLHTFIKRIVALRPSNCQTFSDL